MTWKDYSHFVLLWCCFALVFLTLPLWLPLFWLFMLVRLVKTRVSANSSSRLRPGSGRVTTWLSAPRDLRIHKYDTQ